MAAPDNKFSRRNSEGSELVGDPLDKRSVDVNKTGIIKHVPALHKGFAEKRMFLPFTCPPNAASDQANVEEWQERMTYLQKDLQWMLKLPHHRFWSQVVYHEDFHTCLLSYLSLAPRPFDRVCYSTTLESSQQHLLQTIHRLVFLIYLRMSTYKESKTDHITPLAFGEMIYDNYLFDLPKILDLCALYGNSNSQLLRKMLENIFSYQPQYLEDLADISSLLMDVFDSLLQRLGISEMEYEEAAAAMGAASAPPPNSRPKHLGSLSLRELEEILDDLLDIVHTLSSFLDAYPPASMYLHDSNAEFRIAHFYSHTVQILQEQIDQYAKHHIELQRCFEISRSFLLKLFRDILNHCCIQRILESSSEYKSSELQSYVSDFFRILEECLSEKLFICDYHSNFPVDDDLEIIKQTQCDIDEAHTSYILQSIHAILKPGPFSSAQVSLATLTPHPVQRKPVSSSKPPPDIEGACAGPQIMGAELDSLISHITSLLPDYGEGFLEVCLEYYNYNSEAVVDHLLEQDLPEVLSKIDKSLPRKQINGPTVTVPPDLSLLSERKNVFDGDEFDVFSASATVDMSKIHKGKKNDDAKDILEDREAAMNSKSWYALSDQGPEYATNVYDDEYDDTYDSVGGCAEEPVTPDPLQERRAFTVPRVLRGKDYVEDDENEEEQQNKKHSNWSDDDDKEEIRRPPERETEYTNTKNGPGYHQGARSKNNNNQGPPTRRAWDNVQGKPKGQGQDEKTQHGRSQKEKHKSSYANHNRRAGADRKRNQGMIRT